MMRLNDHPTCCGVKIMCTYLSEHYQTVEELINHITRLKEEVAAEHGEKLIECYFIDRQLMGDDQKLVKALKATHFRKKARWLNSNHGNYITMFTFSRKPEVECPYDW